MWYVFVSMYMCVQIPVAISVMCFTSIYCDNITHIQYNVYVCLCARPAVFTWVWWLSMCLCREAELDEFDLLWLSSSNNPAHTISKPISQSANIWPEVLPHTGMYRLKDNSLIQHKQLAEGLRVFFPKTFFRHTVVNLFIFILGHLFYLMSLSHSL